MVVPNAATRPRRMIMVSEPPPVGFAPVVAPRLVKAWKRARERLHAAYDLSRGTLQQCKAERLATVSPRLLDPIESCRGQDPHCKTSQYKSLQGHISCIHIEELALHVQYGPNAGQSLLPFATHRPSA